MQETDIPLLCSSCLGSNRKVQLLKKTNGKECNICQRRYTSYQWRPSTVTRKLASTVMCYTCARLKNVCQCCVKDMQYGMSVTQRDRINPVNPHLSSADNVMTRRSIVSEQEHCWKKQRTDETIEVQRRILESSTSGLLGDNPKRNEMERSLSVTTGKPCVSLGQSYETPVLPVTVKEVDPIAVEHELHKYETKKRVKGHKKQINAQEESSSTDEDKICHLRGSRARVFGPIETHHDFPYGLKKANDPLLHSTGDQEEQNTSHRFPPGGSIVSRYYGEDEL